MNPFKVLKTVLLAALVVLSDVVDSTMGPSAVANVRLTTQEKQHVFGDPKVTNFVYFDIRMYKSREDYEDWGPLKFALFGEILPVTTHFFIGVAQMTTGGYLGSIIHRVSKSVMFQGGHSGRKAFKEYQTIRYEKFKQENFEVLHTKRGRLSLASTGGDTNSCSYFVTTANHAPYFDGRYVAFGQLVDGFSVLDKINNIPTDGDDPLWEIVVQRISMSSSMDPSAMVYMEMVQENYTYLIYGCVALALVFGANHYRKRRRGSVTKVLKM